MPALDRIACAWVTPVLGVDGKLLYFGPLLRGLAASFARFRVVTAEYRGDPATAGFEIELCGRFRRLYEFERATSQQTEGYHSGISVTGAAVWGRLRARPVDLLIINEFSLFAFFAALTRLRPGGPRVLWIVETQPRLAAGAGLQLPRRLFRRLLARMADAFLTNNRLGQAYLTNELGVDPARIIARPYLVSDVAGSTAAPAVRQRAPGERLRLLYVGQLLKRKGLHVALQAIRQLMDRTPADCTLEIVGDGPYRGELEALAATLGLGDRVIFAGRQPYDTLPAIYARAHAFLFPTLADYRALTPFEALSAGLPIIASRNDGGIAETVDEGRNGFSFDPADPAELTRHLEGLLADPGMLARFSTRSIEMARAYTLDAALETLRIAVRAALGAGRP